MPMYDYICNECKETWEDNLSMANSEKPCGDKCPHCGKSGCVKKAVAGFPGVNVDTTLTADKVTGGRWSEIMGKINNDLPDRYKTGTDMTGHRWRG